MEGDKRKKKNKKKKSKQTKASDNESINGETADSEQNYVADGKLNGNAQTTGNADVQSSAAWELDARANYHQMDEVKHASLKEEIKHLQDEINAQRQKEACFEEKIKHLESEKDSLTSKEKVAKEIIGRLNEENNWLKIKVKELEDAKNVLLQENQRLIKSMSHLEQRIQHLEREGVPSSSSFVETTKHLADKDDASTMVEAARTLVEKLVAENAELVEKVNELYIALERHGISAAQSSMVEIALPTARDATTNAPHPMSQHDDKTPEYSEAMDYALSYHSIEEMVTEVSNDKSVANSGAGLQKNEHLGLPKTGESSIEIVEVPWDENGMQEAEIIRKKHDENNIQVELCAVKSGEDASVPLSDAPLIGAPFRLISFVANYVSGADLVNKKSSDSGR